MRAIQHRLSRLEASTPTLANGENPTADFIRRCLASDGLDLDNAPPLTEDEEAFAERVFEAAAQRTLTGSMLARIER